MEQTIESRFSCGSCGKTFRWKPEIAGKKAKCACGASVTVPINPPGASNPAPKAVQKVAAAVPPKRVVPTTNPVKKPSAQPVVRKVAVAPAPVAPIPTPADPSSDDDYGAYDVAEDDISNLGALLPSAEAIAATEREAQATLVAQAATTAETLEYHRPGKVAKTPRAERIDPSTGELSDPLRDYVAPAILMAAGLAGIAVLVMQKLGIGPLAGLAISIAFGIMLALTLFKTFVLIMAAVPLATYCDVNVGLLRSAILKLAGTILFGDIAILWLVVAMQSAGMISRKDYDGPAVWLVDVVFLSVIYHLCFAYMFRISLVDIKFAALMSFTSRLCNFFLQLIFIALIGSILANRPHPASQYALQAPLTISPGAPVTVQPGQTGPTAMDELISQEIRRSPFGMQEGYAWCRAGMADDADKKLISDMYNAGAGKVTMNGFTMYAQLPDDPAKRAACLKVADAFRHDNGMPPTDNLNYQYVVINLTEERMKKLHH